MQGEFRAENEALLTQVDDEKTSNTEPNKTVHHNQDQELVPRTRFSTTRERHDIKSVL